MLERDARAGLASFPSRSNKVLLGSALPLFALTLLLRLRLALVSHKESLGSCLHDLGVLAGGGTAGGCVGRSSGLVAFVCRCRGGV